MLRWNRKSVNAATIIVLLVCASTVRISFAQTESREPPNQAEAYYETPDLRKPATHHESSVIRKPTSMQQQEAAGSQRDFIMQQYHQLMAQRPGAAAQQRTPAPNQLQQHYTNNLNSNRQIGNQHGKQSAYIGSYQFEGTAKKYVRRQLPDRLVPPGLMSGDSVANNPYKLKSSPSTTFTPPTQLPPASAPSTQAYRQRAMPTGPAPASYRPRAMPAQPSQQLYMKGGQLDSTRMMPPIVQPNNSAGAISRPVYYSSGNENSGNENRQRRAFAPQQFQNRQHLIQPASNQSQKIIRGTSKIPTGYSTEQSMVTRARILMTQDGGDPFGQAPNLSDQEQGGQSSDPFGELPGSSEPSSQEPFDAPPSDLDSQDQQQDRDPPPFNQGKDPFADPPNDFQSNQNRQDPFGDEPSRIREIDPTPASPDNITPNEQFQLPDNASDSGEPNIRDVDQAPSNDPNQSRTGAPDRKRRDLPVGPFKQRFEPTPIQAAPARRDFDPIIVPSYSHSQPQEYYEESGEYYGSDQPTYFDSGQNFQKGDLYEGVSVSPQQRYCNDGCNDQSFARPRLVDRFNLGGGLVQGQLGSRLGGLRSACGNCGSDCGGYCESDVGSNVFAAEECFEPAFYMSVFGGYTQLEELGSFPSVVAFGANAERYSFNDGFGFGIAIGQIQGENLRTELEFTFRDNDADAQTVLSGVAPLMMMDISGSAQTYSGMFNLLWDFRPRPIYGSFRPYAGGGVGFAVIDVDVPFAPVNDASFDSQSSFAYQLIAGISRPVSLHSDAFVEYRYFSAESLVVNALGGPNDTQYETDNIFFGLRLFY